MAKANARKLVRCRERLQERGMLLCVNTLKKMRASMDRKVYAKDHHKFILPGVLW